MERKISITEKIKLLRIIIKSEKNIDIDFENTIIFFDEIQESEDVMLDKEFIYKGDIVENYVQQQLNVNFENIYYWKIIIQQR